jgi:hypothetical protein
MTLSGLESATALAALAIASVVAAHCPDLLPPMGGITMGAWHMKTAREKMASCINYLYFSLPFSTRRL